MTARLRDDCFALPPGIDWTPVDEALARLREGLSPVTASRRCRWPRPPAGYWPRRAVARRANPPAANAAVDGYAFAWASLGGRDEVDLPLEPGRVRRRQPVRATGCRTAMRCAS